MQRETSQLVQVTNSFHLQEGGAIGTEVLKIAHNAVREIWVAFSYIIPGYRSKPSQASAAGSAHSEQAIGAHNLLNQQLHCVAVS